MDIYTYMYFIRFLFGLAQYFSGRRQGERASDIKWSLFSKHTGRECETLLGRLQILAILQPDKKHFTSRKKMADIYSVFTVDWTLC